MTDITVNIEIYCGTCGDAICHNVTQRSGRASYSHNDPTIEVAACETCLQNARDEGLNEATAEHEDAITNLKDDHEEEVAELREAIERHVAHIGELKRGDEE